MVRLLTLSGCCCLFLSVGCVTIGLNGRPGHWPAVVRNPSASQFSGTYSTTPVEVSGNGGETSDKSANLTVFLTGDKKAFKASTCGIVENRGALTYEFKNESGVVSKSSIRSKPHNGHLPIGRRSERVIDPLANGVSNSRYYLYAAEDGSLIGLRKGVGVGLVLGVVPAAGTDKVWMLWKSSDGGKPPTPLPSNVPAGR